jgi:hypothetical protein
MIWKEENMIFLATISAVSRKDETEKRTQVLEIDNTWIWKSKLQYSSVW